MLAPGEVRGVCVEEFRVLAKERCTNWSRRLHEGELRVLLHQSVLGLG
jgi:hypothetical protein